MFVVILYGLQFVIFTNYEIITIVEGDELVGVKDKEETKPEEPVKDTKIVIRSIDDLKKWVESL